MDGNPGSTDQVVAQLIDMGFESFQVMEALEAVGPSLNDAVDRILNHPSKNSKGVSTASNFSAANKNSKSLGKRSFSMLRPSGQMRQSSIMEHLPPIGKPKKSRTSNHPPVTTSRTELLTEHLEGQAEVEKPRIDETLDPNNTSELSQLSYSLHPPQRAEHDMEIGPDWDQKANRLLQKHFGYSELKNFQKEALSAWLAHQDCLVLAATGSGKSICFQLPALLTGKVVVVISPLISLMHDQCLKLAKHGISACFLGSGQPDSSVEKKAMNGMYCIVYVCPETVLRLIKPLQRLAKNRGIALFAIDEVHCVSKWGHDFRPDYRRLSVLRESFSTSSLNFLKFDVPIMALTATATICVREDIRKALCMSSAAKIVLTTFFRPNLQFSVKHSRTSSPSSYAKDFQELVQVYSNKRTASERRQFLGKEDLENASGHSSSTTTDSSGMYNMEDDDLDGEDHEANSLNKIGPNASKEKQLSVEYLEDDFDDIQTADDFDVSCGEFCGQSPVSDWKLNEDAESSDAPPKPAERPKLVRGPLEQGPTIIYIPTRKETLSVAKFLCAKGVKAAAYNAALPKSRLRRVHKEFQENDLDVVVATIAFGMGIDKLNVRRIIHYGWPQSLEAYYQEAGRAGRDGKLADCILYANLSRIPSLLPSKRSEEQRKQAYKMLSDCFRYGMNTSLCRAKILVQYFGEQFQGTCMACDVCRNGPPELLNLKEEANIFIQTSANSLYDDFTGSDLKPNLRMVVTKIREHSQKFLESDQLWWRGLARILEDKGFIRDGSGAISVQVKFPEPTETGLRFLQSDREQDFGAYPEADMLLSLARVKKPFSSFVEWGKGWADPEIRRQRLERRRSNRKPRKQRNRRSRRQQPDQKTVRGRLAAKLSMQKR